MGRWQDEAYFTRRALGTVPWHEPRFADLYQDGQWDGEDVWIIGGGPSIREHDLSQLEGRRSIAVNMGFTVCEPSLVFVGSVLLLWQLAQRHLLADITCPKVTHERAVWNLRSSLGCYVLEVAERESAWGVSVKTGVPAFTNSGLMAVNLADILGARRIFLVGFDMRGAEDGRTANFHRAYPPSMRPPAEHYETYMKDFERARDHCRAEIVNCTPRSRMTLFPTRSFEESLTT